MLSLGCPFIHSTFLLIINCVSGSVLDSEGTEVIRKGTCLHRDDITTGRKKNHCGDGVFKSIKARGQATGGIQEGES